jgi:putative sugar O-methyltransferase
MNAPIQITDDLELLDLMMAEMAEAPAGFRATPYWEYYQSATLEILRTNGLLDLRRLKNPEITSFGCYEGPLFNTPEALLAMGLSERDVEAVGAFVQVLQRHPNTRFLPLGRSITDIIRLELRALEMEARQISPNAVSVFELDCSMAGNPLGRFVVDGHWYTHQHIEKYRNYLECFRAFDLTTVDTVVEIGSGMGQQVEVLRKLHPHLSFVLVDIPPQLYVSHQYLAGIFGDDAVDYRETHQGSLRNLEPGKLYFLGPWMLPGLEPRARTLVWNARSFQEMSEDVVKGYHEVFREFAHYLFLINRAKGFSTKFKQDFGVNDTVDFDFYKNLFDESYECIENPNWDAANNPTSYRPMAWRRREAFPNAI